MVDNTQQGASGPPYARPKGLAIAAVVAGLGALIFVLIFVVTSAGIFPLVTGATLGLLGVIFGIVALARRQPKGLSITGIIAGVISLLFSLGMILFALLFVGAFT